MTRHYYAIAHTYSGNMRNRDTSMIGQVYAFDTLAGRAAWIAERDNPLERGWRQELRAIGLTVRKALRDVADGADWAIIWHAEQAIAAQEQAEADWFSGLELEATR